MKKFNLSEIMIRAWTLYRNGVESFSEALHRAWEVSKAEPVNAERIEAAKAAAGVTEEVKTWKGWKDAGFEVIHESKCLFQAVLIYASKGDGATYKASFFGASQVQPIPAAA